MAWQNTVKVNIGEMGTLKGNCLGNTRVAASPDIPSLYKTAWEAEQHCTLHSGSPPLGVWTPAFFSFYATIDGVYKNWGHVGWHSPTGKFYSDGVAYSSISAYTASHSPKYVGWGELLNGVRVVKYVAAPVPTGKRTLLHLNKGTITTTYDKNGSIYARDDTYNYTILQDLGYKVQIHSNSVGGNCWVYLIYQTGDKKGQTIPGRWAK